MRTEPKTAKSILTPTGGFLKGAYTHTLNPAQGCAFAPGLCGRFCYARGFAERFHPGSWGHALYPKANAPELLEAELTRAARRSPDHPHHVGRLSIFCSSTTDPCAGAVLELTRAALEVLAAFSIARLVLQTRAPAVRSLVPAMRELGERAVLSFTLETDDEQLWAAGPPGAPGIAVRRRAFEELSAELPRRHLAVAPCLPIRKPEAFADWIAAHATDATVDTFSSGDGSSGRRTAGSELPAWLAARGGDWRDEGGARALHRALAARMGDRVGWSEAGFARLGVPSQGGADPAPG